MVFWLERNNRSHLRDARVTTLFVFPNLCDLRMSSIEICGVLAFKPPTFPPIQTAIRPGRKGLFARFFKSDVGFINSGGVGRLAESPIHRLRPNTVYE